MKGTALGLRSAARQTLLGFFAVAVLVVPDSLYSIVAEESGEVMILRMLTLIGLSLLAALPWVSGTGVAIRRRVRRWSIPGVAATTVYLISADPLYLILGFCLLAGGALDVWVTRVHVATDHLRIKVTSRETDRDA